MANKTLVQAAAAFIFNANYPGFATGAIYRGDLKKMCVPVLNCYSCPGALGSCPVGALQSVAAGYYYSFSFYAAGILVITGALLGRLACGWLCPFGFIQDLLYRLPGKKARIPQWMRYPKYVILALFVLLMPAFATNALGMGEPYFCKWLCPAGTLEAALPLYFTLPGIRESVGLLFSWRILLLLIVLFFIIRTRRAFCQAFCPLGAIYSFFNPVSLYSLEVDRRLCSGCGKCSQACYASLPVRDLPNHPECIRCLECIKKCPSGAISWRMPGIFPGMTGRRLHEDQNTC